MKRHIFGIAVAALAALMCVSFIGCGESNETDGTGGNSASGGEHVHFYNVDNKCSCGETWDFSDGIYCVSSVTGNSASVTSTEESLSGTVVIPYGHNSRFVTSIGPSAFSGRTKITEIVIPGSLMAINDWAFFRCSSLTKITFDGTKSEWNSVKKGESWDMDTGNYTVVCKDGTIEKAS